jgi:hypothetical protein
MRTQAYAWFMDRRMELKWEPHPKITDVDTIKRMVAFYTRKEAANYAASIGWPKNSARKVFLPFGRIRFVISDEHCNIIMAEPAIDDPEDIRMDVEHLGEGN